MAHDEKGRVVEDQNLSGPRSDKTTVDTGARETGEDEPMSSPRTLTRPLVLASIGMAAVVAIGALVFLQTRKSSPELAAAEINQGLAAQVAGQLDVAAAHYTKALQHDPNNKFAYFDLGVIEQTKGNNGGAESFYRKALSIDPDFTGALFNLAIVRKTLGDPQGAIALYRQTIAASPDYANAHLNLGFLLIEVGQKKEGRAELAIAIQLDPNLTSRVPPQDRPRSSSASPSPSAS